MILVTGGAGFIGGHLVEELVRRGHRTRVLDAFVEQVHRESTRELPGDVEVIRGDIRDKAAVASALEGVEVVFHQAAEVGVGQSMYEIERYVGANTFGTAALLEAVIGRRGQIKKLIVASSMSIYGEGAYVCPACGSVSPSLRSAAQLESRDWEMRCPECTTALQPIATSENKPLDPASVYAVTKQDQEQLCLIAGRAYGI